MDVASGHDATEGVFQHESRRCSRRWVVFGALFVLFLVAGGIIVSGDPFCTELEVTHYHVASDKLSDSPITLAVLTDFHSRYRGRGPTRQDSVEAVQNAHPDVVLLAGDIVDERTKDDNPAYGEAFQLADDLASKFPCYYVTGNHEWKSEEASEIKDEFRRRGVTVLEGTFAELEIRGQVIRFAGVDDPNSQELYEQLDALAAHYNPERLTVLLAHRPGRLGLYAAHGFDVVVSGHAHGGQWRIPGVRRGLIAPGQGLFPRYVTGLYERDETTMLVSRGLSAHSLVPRIFNRPELPILTIEPVKKSDAALRKGD